MAGLKISVHDHCNFTFRQMFAVFKKNAIYATNTARHVQNKIGKELNIQKKYKKLFFSYNLKTILLIAL